MTASALQGRNSRAAHLLLLALLLAFSSTALSKRVFVDSDAALYQALEDPAVTLIEVEPGLMYSLEGVPAAEGAESERTPHIVCGRNLTISSPRPEGSSSTNAGAGLSFSMRPGIVEVCANATLTFDNVVLSSIARHPNDSPNEAPTSDGEYYNVGLVPWPSVRAAPGARIAFNRSTLYTFLKSCEPESIAAWAEFLRQVYGEDNVEEQPSGTLLKGLQQMALPVSIFEQIDPADNSTQGGSLPTEAEVIGMYNLQSYDTLFRCLPWPWVGPDMRTSHDVNSAQFARFLERQNITFDDFDAPEDSPNFNEPRNGDLAKAEAEGSDDDGTGSSSLAIILPVVLGAALLLAVAAAAALAFVLLRRRKQKGAAATHGGADDGGEAGFGAAGKVTAQDIKGSAINEDGTAGAEGKGVAPLTVGVWGEAPDDLRIGPCIGTGGYARVYMGTWHSNRVAIKMLDDVPSFESGCVSATGAVGGASGNASGAPSGTASGAESPAADPSDAQVPTRGEDDLLCCKASHPNVVQFYRIWDQSMDDQLAGAISISAPSAGSTSTSSNIAAGTTSNDTDSTSVNGLQARQPKLQRCVLMEYCDMGTLFDAVRGMRTFGDEQLRCLLDVANAMDHLHTQGILHNDLKSTNVLRQRSTSDPRGYVCKVADFGLSRFVRGGAGSLYTQNIGTAAYQAPEVLSRGRLSRAADAYSFAMVAWVLVAREEPHAGATIGQVYYALVNEQSRMQIPEDCPPELAALMSECWAEDPSERPAFPDIRRRLSAMLAAAACPGRRA